MLAGIVVRKFPTVMAIAGLALVLSMILGFALPAAAGENSQQGRGNSTLYATGQAGTVLLAIDVEKGTTAVIGPTGQPGSLALAITPDGTAAYTVAKFRNKSAAQLAKIDLATGAAKLVGSPLGVDLKIMGMTFAPDGVLYAAGDFTVSPTVSPTFNSLYKIDLTTGLATRVGSFGTGPNTTDFIMSFAWDSHGNLYGASMMSLYRIDLTRATNAATKVVDFVGSSQVMGIAIDEDGNFYAADFVGPTLEDPDLTSTIYGVDVETGFLTPLFNTGVANVHNIAFSPQGRHD